MNVDAFAGRSYGRTFGEGGIRIGNRMSEGGDRSGFFVRANRAGLLFFSFLCAGGRGDGLVLAEGMSFHISLGGAVFALEPMVFGVALIILLVPIVGEGIAYGEVFRESLFAGGAEVIVGLSFGAGGLLAEIVLVNYFNLGVSRCADIASSASGTGACLCATGYAAVMLLLVESYFASSFAHLYQW